MAAFTVKTRLASTSQLINKFVKCRYMSTGESKSNATWNLYGALCIQRRPIISRDPLPIETEFKNLLTVQEYENSYLNDHELRKLKEKKKSSAVDSEETVLQTAVDLEDVWNVEFGKFKPASRVSTVENNNDRRSLKRFMERRLILVVKSKQFGDWRLPSCLYNTGETLRQTAERGLQELFSSQLTIAMIGNAPIGFHKFQYSPKIDTKLIPNQASGGKIFFFRAYHVKGDLKVDSNNSEIADYAWLNAEELCEVFNNRKLYLKSIQNFLPDESITYEHSECYKMKQKKGLRLSVNRQLQ